MRIVRGLLVVGLVMSAASAANIRHIDLEGFQRVSVGAVRKDLPLKPGQPFAAEEVDRAVDWLRALGLFVSVKAETRDSGQIVDVILRVVENPLVKTVRIEGNTHISSAALRPLLKTQPRQLLDRRLLSQDAVVIGQAYLADGLRVVVEAAFDPPPDQPDVPVQVIYKITELRLGEVRVEPLHYLRRDKLPELLVLQPGALVRDKELIDQQRRLAATGLFRTVSQPVTADPGPDGRLDVRYNVAEAEHPLLTAETLSLVDVKALCRYARFTAVDVAVELRDFEVYRSPTEIQQELASATAAARAAPNDPEALYQRFRWLRRAGQDAAPAARDCRRALATAPATALTHLRLGQVLHYLGERQAAGSELEAAAADPATRVAAYAGLLDVRMADLHSRDEAAREKLRQAVLNGIDAVAAMPGNLTMEQLSEGFRFYYTALTISLLRLHVEAPLRLDGAGARRLMEGVYDLSQRGLSAAEARHLGRMVTAAAFAAKAIGEEICPPEVWTGFQQLLDAAGKELLPRDLFGADDPAAWFYVALNEVLRNDPAAARAAVLAGLKRQPDNERLLDVYLLTCVGQVSSEEHTIDLLRASIQALQKKLVDQSLPGWGPLLLLAKLNLALRDNLPARDAAGREEARQAAESAARNAVAADSSRIAGWWILGLAQMKGPNPGAARATYQKVVDLNPRYRECGYALALSTLAAGDTAGGLAGMKALAGN